MKSFDVDDCLPTSFVCNAVLFAWLVVVLVFKLGLEPRSSGLGQSVGVGWRFVGRGEGNGNGNGKRERWVM